MNPRAQRFLTRGGALSAAGLTFAALTAAATPAQAAPDWARDNLSATKALALSAAGFWLDSNGAALKKATQYNRDVKAVTTLVASRSQSVADGKPGAVVPIGGENATVSKVKNVNLPKTVGKVFFVDHKGEYRWCSATSIQSTYRNLVATAGHCVYDVEGNRDVMDKWMFVPGYYQGKAPWGVYVGQAAFTHYNFAVHEDFDHDYAFVAVYNGLQIGGSGKVVTKAEWDKHTGDKEIRSQEISKAQFDDCTLNLTGDCYSVDKVDPQNVDANYPGAVVTAVETTAAKYEKAGLGKGNGNKLGAPETTPLTEAEWKDLAKPDSGNKGTLSKKGEPSSVTRYYVQQWIKPGSDLKYYKKIYVVLDLVKDVGRLGDNVGGQGFAWNQKAGQPVYAFGYPAEAHPDGDKPFTGVTMKYCYGKTNTRTYSTNAYKIENHLALKCSMTGGSDGGPWLLKYSNAKRLGYVNGVTSAFHDQDGNSRVDFVSSPYFDGDSAGVYREARQVRNARIVGDKGELLK
ncbi:trypsin-like serine peptidase [Planomonospora parontospora]|uniref:trypsin-like serine peptidase n=1 Tax=Planomonospora parontospora TaxID=58119 RepID=UPI0019AA74F0|nr:hypothetical protein [Planomonospora parontospora]GGL52216.1 hypothetical protein GCM10014719_61910 [Planomonospora parontospora subsp. antibiotica]GII19474.1 hypothetical protein Ppa05_62000 [Planomonospora parontospora subsp. antibiotica]